MRKFWLVLANEYKRHVLRKRFVFVLLSMPLLVLVILLAGYLAARVNFNSQPIGYIDPANIIATPRQVPPEPDSLIPPPVQVIRFADEGSAKEALMKGEIQAYFVLSEQYIHDGMVNMITAQSPSNNASADFGKFMTYNLVSTLPSQVSARLIEGKNLVIRSLDGTREMNANDWSSILLPLLSGVLFIIAINISSGYLLQAVVEEKENRTMEILVTSVSPTQLMAGKISGDLLVGLTQLIVWILFAIIGLQIAPRYLPIDLSFSISGSQLSILALTFLPAFILISGLMGAVGGISTDVREAQQISSIFSLPMIIPYWFITPIMFNPNGPIAVGMSLFPLTAPVVLPMRVVFTTVPAWQIILSIGLLWLFAVLSMRLAGMVFRRGMLQYGKRLSFKQVFQRGS